MSFEEISLVIPFIELAYDSGVDDLNAPQPGCIRGYKTHECKPFSAIVEGTKCIYIARHPLQVATSFFHFFEGWMFDEGTIQVDEFVEGFFMDRGKSAPTKRGDRGSVWHHFLTAYPDRADDNCLFLFYEDLVEHKEECVKLVAAFLGIDLTDALLATAMAQSDHSAMARTPSKYDDHPIKLRRNEAMGRPLEAGISGDPQSTAASGTKGKVRSPGKAKARLSEATTEALLATWERIMTPETGCKTYEEFRAKVNSELGRPFAPR